MNKLYSIWKAVPQTPCFVILNHWKPPKFFSAYAPVLCCFLPFSSPCQSLISLFCCFFRLSQVSLRLAAVALGLTPLLLLDYYTLHEPCLHSLRLGRRRRCPPIVKFAVLHTTWSSLRLAPIMVRFWQFFDQAILWPRFWQFSVSDKNDRHTCTGKQTQYTTGGHRYYALCTYFLCGLTIPFHKMCLVFVQYSSFSLVTGDDCPSFASLRNIVSKASLRANTPNTVESK